MVANQTINIKRGFWRQVEMRNLTYTLSPHSPFAALTDPPKGGKKGAHGLKYFHSEAKLLMVDVNIRAVRFN